MKLVFASKLENKSEAKYTKMWNGLNTTTIVKRTVLLNTIRGNVSRIERVSWQTQNYFAMLNEIVVLHPQKSCKNQNHSSSLFRANHKDDFGAPLHTLYTFIESFAAIISMSHQTF